MANIDSAVKYAGKTYRLITKGTQAALFDKSGIVHRLTVTEEALRRGLPTMETAEGEVASLARTGKPCSCKGAPWSTSSLTLREQM